MMTKEEVLKFVETEGLYSANRLFLNGEELADWSCEETSLLSLFLKYKETRDCYWLGEVRLFRTNLIDRMSSKLFELSLSQSISHMENDTHCKIETSPCEGGETNIDCEVVSAIVQNISDSVDRLLREVGETDEGGNI